MPTTLYFAPNTMSAKVAGTYPTAATNYIGTTPTVSVTTEGYMLPAPSNGVQNLTMSSSNRTTAQTARFGRFFSAPFAEDFTYTQPTAANPIRFFMADYESNLSANHCIQQCGIYVWRPSTGAIVATLVPVTVLAIGSKEPTAVNSIQATLGTYSTTTTTTVAIKAGDILVFEPWSTSTQGASTAYTIRFYYGGSTEITTENTVVATPASKVQFHIDLPLEQIRGTVSGSVRYVGKIKFLAPEFKSNLFSAARAPASWLDDASPFNTKAKARATVTAPLTAKILFKQDLKSISRAHGWAQQSHKLTSSPRSAARASASFPDIQVGESLHLYYSGGASSVDNPALSIGGPIGPSLAGLSFTQQTIIPGLTILSVFGLVVGDHDIRVDAQTKTVALHIEGGAKAYASGIDQDRPTVVLIGSVDNGFAAVHIDPAAITTARTSITVAERQNTLYLNPAPEIVSAGETLFRCLYLYNRTDQDIDNVTLGLACSGHDVVQVASEFASGDVVSSDQGITLDQRFRALDATGWGGIFHYEGFVQVGSETTAYGLPLLIDTPMAPQASDGIAHQLPMQLVDQHDSTGLLRNLAFGPTLTWTRIKAQRGVSFWVKKTMPPGGSGDNTTKLRMSVSADY